MARSDRTASTLIGSVGGREYLGLIGGREGRNVRSADEFNSVQKLIAAGMNDCEIARETGIPRPTVREWRARSPKRHRLRCADSPCGADHNFSELPPREYSYLLGLYLGDGVGSGRKVSR
ncbi:helix-turn-helix domain-containing protein [Mycobacterium sp. NS-7484]|uniref:helix-turn-helix domain-containing protein n=1 Tax=Mycobacterium sp. NS-7484 TaxID=1834161 RepID=UPI00351643F7